MISQPLLISSKDLAEITELAQGRKCWRGLTARINKAAEVSQTKNLDAKTAISQVSQFFKNSIF